MYYSYIASDIAALMLMLSVNMFLVVCKQTIHFKAQFVWSLLYCNLIEHPSSFRDENNHMAFIVIIMIFWATTPFVGQNFIHIKKSSNCMTNV